MLHVVDRQADKVSHLVAQLLDVSRIESGRLRPELRPMDLVPLVRSVVAAVSTIGKGKQTIVVDAPETAWVHADPLRLEQVLTNLLDNAIKFSPGDAARIDIQVAVGETGQVLVAVRDRGIGIPPEHRARIFDRLHQAHAAEHRSGMGLGLFISREIIHLHGGSLEVEFPPDGGSRFVVTLPPAATAPAEDTRAPAGAAARSHGGA
jgi:signal transduction histidine kinase